MFVSLALYWLFIAHHAGGVAQQYINFRHGIGIALWVAAWLYVAYLALEPYVRRRWPSMLVSWNRVVFGRVADPRVGRDVFTGCLLGVLVAIISQFRFTLATWINIPGHIPPTWLVPVGLGTTLGHITYSVYECLIYPVGGAAALLLFSFLTRRTWMAVSLLILTLTVLQLKGTPAVIDIPAAMLGAMVFVFALMRFGVLGAAACYFVFSLMQYDIPTFDFERWYAAASVLCLACIAGLAVYSFRAALAGRPAFGRAVLED